MCSIDVIRELPLPDVSVSSRRPSEAYRDPVCTSAIAPSAFVSHAIAADMGVGL